MPDEFGNVELDGVVYTVNGIEPDSNGNVEVGNVRSVDYYPPDEYGNINLNCVRKVQGLTPDASGNVSFGMQPDRIMYSDYYGNVSTIDTPSSGQTFTIVSDVTWNGT